MQRKDVEEGTITRVPTTRSMWGRSERVFRTDEITQRRRAIVGGRRVCSVSSPDHFERAIDDLIVQLRAAVEMSLHEIRHGPGEEGGVDGLRKRAKQASLHAVLVDLAERRRRSS